MNKVLNILNTFNEGYDSFDAIARHFSGLQPIGGWGQNEQGDGTDAVQLVQNFAKSDHEWMVIVHSNLYSEGFGFANREDANEFVSKVEKYDPDAGDGNGAHGPEYD